MSENAEQGQGPEVSEAKPRQSNSGGQTTPGNDGEERQVPYHRFQELNQTNKQLKSQLDEIKAEQERVEEERAQKQGEYQKLADKYKTQAQQEKEKRQQIESNWERERRLNMWTGAAAGVIKPEAVVDAFSMLDADDFANIDAQDESQVRRLAEMLVERKPYLADGPVGAGSGGSDRPILGNPRSPDGSTRQGTPNVPMTSSGRLILKKKNRRAAWK